MSTAAKPRSAPKPAPTFTPEPEAAVSAASTSGNGKTGKVRNSAIVTILDFADAVDASALPEQPAPISRITRTLTLLREATLNGEVPYGDDGLKFVAVAKHTSPSGAQTTLRGLQQKPTRCPDGIDAWEFRKVPVVGVDGKTASHLRARYVGLPPVGDS